MQKSKLPESLERAKQADAVCQWAESLEALKEALELCSPTAKSANALNNAGFRRGAKKLLNTMDAAIAPAEIECAIEWTQAYLEEGRTKPSSITSGSIKSAIAYAEYAS